MLTAASPVTFHFISDKAFIIRHGDCILLFSLPDRCNTYYFVLLPMIVLTLLVAVICNPTSCTFLARGRFLAEGTAASLCLA